MKFILILFNLIVFVLFISTPSCATRVDNTKNYYEFLLSQYYKNNQQYEKAINEMERLLPNLRSENEKIIVYNELIQLNFILKKYDNVRKWGNKIIEIRPDDNITHIFIAKSFINEEKFTDAMTYMENVLKNKKGNIDVFLNLMSLYTITKNQKRAIDFLENTNLTFVSDEIKYYFLLLLYYENNQYDKVLAYIDKYIDFYNGDDEAKARNMQSIIQILVELLDKNYQKEKIISLIKKISEKDKSNSHVKLLYIHLLLSQGNKQEAYELLKTLDEKLMENFILALDILKAYISLDISKAYEFYEIFKQKFPNKKETNYLLANIKEEEKKYDEAIKIYKELIQDKHESKIFVNSLIRLIDLLKKNNKSNEAREILEKSYNDTNSYFVLQMLVDFYFEEELYEDALKLVKKEISKIEQSQKKDDLKKLSELKYHYFLLLDKLGNTQEAINLALKELENDPNNAHLLNFIGYTYVDKDIKLDEAENLLKKAISLSPEDPFILDSIGWLYYRKKDFPLALDYLYRSLKGEPDDPTILEHVAEVYYSMGNKEKAIEYLKKSLNNFKKQNKDFIRVRDRLKQIESESK